MPSTRRTRAPWPICGVREGARLRIAVHVSETRLEHEECKQRHDGLTPVRYFESLGVLDVPVTAAHCVWVDDGDIDVLAERGVFVAANPASNHEAGQRFRPCGEGCSRAA